MMKLTRKSVKISKTLKCLSQIGQKLKNLSIKLRSKWIKELMDKEKEQSRVGKNLRKSLIRNERVLARQLTKERRGSKRG